MVHGFFWNLAPSLPGLRKERLLLVNIFLIGVFEASCDYGDLDAVLHVVVLHGAKNDVRVFVRRFLNHARSFVNFVQSEARAAGNIDQNSLCALNGIVFEERAGNGAVRSIHGAVRAGGYGGTHHGVALAMHDGFHVREVAIDDAGYRNDIRDALHRLTQDVISDTESIEEAGAPLDGVHQALVGDDDDGVDGADKFLKGLFGLHHAALAFEGERFRDDGNTQRAQFAGERSYDGRRAAARASAEAGGNKNHVRAFQRFDNFFRVFKGGFAADFGIGARAESFGELRA